MECKKISLPIAYSPCVPYCHSPMNFHSLACAPLAQKPLAQGAITFLSYQVPLAYQCWSPQCIHPSSFTLAIYCVFAHCSASSTIRDFRQPSMRDHSPIGCSLAQMMLAKCSPGSDLAVQSFKVLIAMTLQSDRPWLLNPLKVLIAHSNYKVLTVHWLFNPIRFW